MGNNQSKKRYFDLEVMQNKIQTLYKDEPKVEVLIYTGLTSNFAKDVNAQFLLRGLRNTTDFEYENTIAQVNSQLNKDLETVFLITDPNQAYISSSIVRELHKFNADVSSLVPYQL